MSEPAPLPFDDLRRLTGPNLYFAGPGAVLETLVGAPVPPALIEDWKRRIARARAALGWPDGPVTVREHASGASLAFAAPGDMLYTAADVNEAPVISTPGAVTMLENTIAGTPVAQLTATEEDRYQVPVFSITSGNGAGYFAINSSTGQITVATPPSVASDTVYSLVVQAADAEGNRAESAVRGGVRVAAGDRGAGLGDALLRSDHVDDALGAGRGVEEADAVVLGVLTEGLDHLLGDRVGVGLLELVGRDDVVDRGEGALRVFHLEAEVPEHAEGLGARHLMDEVRADEQLGLAVRQLAHRMRFPNFLEQGLSHLGKR